MNIVATLASANFWVAVIVFQTEEMGRWVWKVKLMKSWQEVDIVLIKESKMCLVVLTTDAASEICLKPEV